MSAELAPVPPEDKPAVFDLDACIAERPSVAPFSFIFAGEEYVLPSRPDVRAAAALEAGNLRDGMRFLLGAEQWERLQAVDAVFDDEAFVMIQLKYAEYLGDDLPESLASALSSANMEKR